MCTLQDPVATYFLISWYKLRVAFRDPNLVSSAAVEHPSKYLPACLWSSTQEDAALQQHQVRPVQTPAPAVAEIQKQAECFSVFSRREAVISRGVLFMYF